MNLVDTRINITIRPLKGQPITGPVSKRGCTDVILLPIYLVLIGFLAYVLGRARNEGDLDLLLSGSDSYGNICGKDNKPIDGVPQSGEDMSERDDVMDAARDVMGAVRDVIPVACEALPSKMLLLLWLRSIPCFNTTAATREALLTKIALDNSNFRTMIFNRCISLSIQEASGTVSDVIAAGTDFIQEVGEDIERCWREIVYLIIIALLLSIVILVLLRYASGLIIWTILLSVAVCCVAGTIILWLQYKKYKDLLKELGSIRPKYLVKQVNLWLAGAIIVTIVTIIILLVILVMRKRIAMVIALFKEASKAVIKMPALFLAKKHVDYRLRLGASEYRSAFLRQLRDMLNMKQSTLGHKDMQMTRIIKDEADVQALVTMLESNWINPFDENSQELEIENGRVLSHLLGPLPMALASPDGLMRTTYKLSLGHELQNNVVPAANIPQPCCCIIDGMALVQKMRGEGTFSELASTLLGSILIEGRTCSRIDVVFDVYRARSIKDAERLRRGSSTGTSFKNIAPGHKLHQWRKFLANSNNKECLVTFLVKEWQEEKHRKKLNDKSLFVTRGKLCYHVTSSGTQIASDLESTQEEADIRMLLHAAHASRSDYEAIVVVSDDTDVLVLCLAFKPSIPTNMYVKCGTKTRVKYADITKVFNALGYELSQALKIRLFHLFMMIWNVQFVISCQHMVVAGAVCKWYFTRFSKSKLGACIKMASCCLWIFEKILAHLNRTAYVEICIYGQNFCISAKRAFKVMTSNILRIFAINSVGDFVLFLSKIGLTLSIFFIGLELVKSKEEHLNYVWVPGAVGALFAYVIALAFVSIYEVDNEQNNGNDKPYFMSKGLMVFIDNCKQEMAITQEINNDNVTPINPEKRLIMVES
ncbi:Choline transporter-like protein 1 [Nymphon striatum]|nr:Choline transporter-like protein 1 [Nymphon striatum]